MAKLTEKPYFAIREPENTEDGPTHEEIEARAYQIHLEHGRAEGHDVEDWLQAEQELLSRQAKHNRIDRRAAS